MDRNDQLQAKINKIKDQTDPFIQAQMVVDLLRTDVIRHKDLSRELGIKPSYLSHLIRVMKLPEIVTDGYLNKQLTFTHLILISRLKKTEDILRLYEETLRDSLNVSAVERRVREILYLVDSTGKYIPKTRLQELGDRISSSVGQGARVNIIQTRIKAKIQIEVPGNLDKTSTLIENFARKYRRSKSQEETEKSSPQIGQDVQGVRADSPSDQGVSHGGGAVIATDRQTEMTESSTKYRFDPDI